MSFQDVALAARQPATPSSAPATPRVRVQSPEGATDADSSTLSSPWGHRDRYNKIFRYDSHGRVSAADDETEDSSLLLSPHSSVCEPDMPFLHPQYMELYQQLQEFRRLISEIDHGHSDARTAETLWRAKILIRSAKDIDMEASKNMQKLWRRLQKTGGNASVHTAFVDLAKELYQTRKDLGRVVSRHGEPAFRPGDRFSRHVSTPSRGAVTNHGSEPVDYFDRVTRQEDLNQVQSKMNMVRDIFRNLAELVDEQQVKIDKLSDNVVDAKITAEAAADEVTCFATKLGLAENPCSAMAGVGHGTGLEDDGDVAKEWNFYDFLFGIFDCPQAFSPCQSDDATHEVDILCEDDGVIEIQHVEPQKSADDAYWPEWFEKSYALQESLVEAGTTLLARGNSMTCSDL